MGFCCLFIFTDMGRKMNLNIEEIKKMPINVSCQPESVFQVYHVLNLAIKLLESNVPHAVILSIINECRSVHGEDWPFGWVRL